MKNNRLSFLIACLCSAMIISAYAVVTDFKEYLPADERTDIKISQWNTLLALFNQKAGDTATGDQGITGGNLLINTAGKGIVIKEGTDGRSGTIAFASGGLSIISNSSVTALSRIQLTPKTAAAGVSVMTATNIVGVGFQLIPVTVNTNTYNYLITEGQ